MQFSDKISYLLINRKPDPFRPRLRYNSSNIRFLGLMPAVQFLSSIIMIIQSMNNLVLLLSCPSYQSPLFPHRHTSTCTCIQLFKTSLLTCYLFISYLQLLLQRLNTSHPVYYNVGSTITYQYRYV